ncbi:MAG: carboxypeptidase-like regulatory domain-containing protein [Pirellula sp.]|jgi:hypothetical protein
MKRLSLAFGLLMLFMCLGCGGSVDGRLPTYKVSGTVKYKGKLLENADVILQFAEHNKTSFGRTNSSGEFALTTYENADGALAGEALITVTKWEELPASTAPIAGQPGYDPSKAYVPEKAPKLLVPKKYSDFKTSGLKIVIDANSKNPPLNLELED